MLNKQVNQSWFSSLGLMNVLGFILTAVIANVASAQAVGPGICFSDVASWNAVKAQLPAQLQNDYLYASHNSWDLVGGIAIFPQGAQLALDGRVHQVVAGDIINSGFITQACVDGNSIKVALSNGKTESMTLGQDSVNVLGYTFEFTDYQTYLNTINLVQ
jgi:hypothetical protein